ncbi:receptor-like protein 43 [Hibiscus syriacus]|uniref:receptor-like protein 43 n=1 Tax=Hibiscus syriacus TaxID=106335 RepID=UPI001920F9EE|nr:receptor-like protein 43 [Hibiscus syriacus]
MSKLSEFDISFNSFNHLEVRTEKLWLGGNNLTGLFPWKFQNVGSKLTVLDISDNFLHGTLPGDIDLNLPHPCHLDLSNNTFNGSLPPFFGDQLQMLDLSDNQFQGEIPHSMISNMSSLLYLSFQEHSHVSCRRAWSRNLFDIQNNEFSGELSWYLPVLPKLKYLLLGGNRFEGQIPRQVCQMRDLHVLDVTRKCLSGEILDFVDNVTCCTWTDNSQGFNLEIDYLDNIEIFNKGALLTYYRLPPYLRGTDVSSNKLTGQIPIQMTRLEMILFLNMSTSLLTGQTPSSLANLTVLQSLHLSHNSLFVTIPLN